MHKKMSAVRRRVFLNYLSQSGNVTLSAERAKVSRSWVCKQRANDAGFDAACDAAIVEADLRLQSSTGSACAQDERDGEGQAGPGSGPGRREGESLSWAPDQVRGTRRSNRPPSGWGFLDGAELVVRGTGGAGPKRVQIARARPGQWTARTEARFLGTLASTCNATAAVAELKMARSGAYNHRTRWAGFAERWAGAVRIAYFRIEAALVETGGNLFGDAPYPVDSPLPPMTVQEAIQLLHMHKHAVRGIGKAPGGPKLVASPAEIAAALERRIETFASEMALSKEEKARFKRECAKRSSTGSE
jgi:hypothetical protein